MDAPRRDMELLSNSLAAYAHIRGEGGGGNASLPAPLRPHSAPSLPTPTIINLLTPSQSPTPNSLHPGLPSIAGSGYLMSFK